MESDSDLELTPPSITEAANLTTLNLLPEISKKMYKRAYNLFLEWKGDRNAKSFSENVSIAYFGDLAKKFKSSTLWTQYSMLRTTLIIHNNIDITKYLKLKAFLKPQSDGYRPKKSKIFTSNDINKFIKEAPYEIYLATKFYSMLERNEWPRYSLTSKQLTIFAPTNEAFQNYNKDQIDTEESLVLYHMINLAKTVDQLGSSNSYVTTDLAGNPPLWITVNSELRRNEYYINNAKILLTESNFRSKNARKDDQVLHKIDKVLVPVLPAKSVQNPIFNPNAWEFIDKFESFNFRTFRIRSFRQKILEKNKQDVFKFEGGNTYFIPIDDGFKDSKPESVDGRVIDGHVIPRQVLFTSPAKKDYMFPTMAESDNIKSFISFSQEGKTTYIKSHTLVSEGNITKGVVVAAIKEANIPVKNGVVHLIHKPLMVVDQSVKQFLEEKEDGPLSQFYQEIMDSGDIGDEFMRTIQNAQTVTLFAPRNSAWDDVNLKELLRKDKSIFRDLLNLHLVLDEKLYLERIKDNNIRQAPTLNKKKSLYFNVIVHEKNTTLTVEGGGVNATVVQPDIAAVNGVIHIIDRVLGVPFTTVVDKLRSDPMLNDTYHLGKNCGFNRRFEDPTRKFTYFVPRDKAWQQARTIMPSAIKKLFMNDFCYFARQILEKHLIVSDTAYTMEKIKNLANDTSILYGKETYNNKKEVELDSTRDNLKIAVEERINGSFAIHWKSKRITVFRPNVECTNGVIHVIDFPFLEENDIRISASSPLSLTPHLLMLTLAKWLLL